MEIDKIMILVDKVAASPISSLCIEEGSMKISIKKQDAQAVTSIATPAPIVEMEAPANTKPSNDVGKEITSPIVGTFYAGASPNSDPLVKVGDYVKKGQVIGLIEAMKLMNEIECEEDGMIAEVLVENEQGVEYGQPLFRVN